ncbi:hypothetical protein HB820_04885 [Listeria booriae]|uniref:hypothetical protein n=1 Tax=Listeria booriae TaxID=1552123 RepID=UPI0016238AC1|nr:hypothetical protein [Listeria booriae]MBC1334624.1 hypothetical protein [Listeria booriae]
MIIEKLKKDEHLSVQITNSLGNEIISVYGKYINNNSVDLDTAIRLKKIDLNWTLYEVQRDQEYLIREFSDETLAKLSLYLYVSNHFNPVEPDDVVIEKLWELESDSDLEVADNCLADAIGSQYYSFRESRIDCINLKLREDNHYDIYYLSPTGEIAMISEDRKLPNAFIVVYNFGFVLKQFKEVIYPQLIAYDLSPSQVELLKRVYLKK